MTAAITRKLLLLCCSLTLAVGLLPLATAQAQAPPPVSGAGADAFGVEAALALGGGEVLRVPATPEVAVRLPDGSGETQAEAADSLLTVGPLGEEPSLGTVGAATVSAQATLGQDGLATSRAEVTEVQLLVPDAVTGPVITADVIRSQSTTTCAEQTLEEAAAGSQFVGLSIAGQAIPVDVPANTVVEVPGVARVTVKQVVPDADAVGFTVRGLVVQTIDPLSGALGAEVVVAEAHSSVACEGDGGPPIAEVEDLAVTKDVQGEQRTFAPGEEVAYDLTITNVTDTACTLTRVVDLLPEGFVFVSLGGDLADATTEVTDGRLVAELSATLEPDVPLVGELVLRIGEDVPAGTYFNDVRATSTCGIGRSGITAPVTVGEAVEQTFCPARPEVTRFDAAARGPALSRTDAWDGEDTARVFGQDRTETTVRLSEAVFPFADAAIVARSDEFPDALAASGLAAEICGPLLLTPPDQLAASVRDELERLDVDTVYIVGGEAAVQPQVAQAIQDEGYELVRLGGTGRHETAREIALEIVELGGQVSRATIVRADIFPDAMSGANLATWGRAPILLTDSDRLNPPTAQALEEILQAGSNDLYVVGGDAAVSPVVEAELTARGYATERLAGYDRYATTAAVHAEALQLGAGLSRVWVASGLDFPDALAGGVAAFVDGSALMLIAPDTIDNSPPTRDYVAQRASQIETGVIVGGPAAVSEQVEQELRAILEG